MALGWGTRRQSLYLAVGILVSVVLALIIYQLYFTATPTCFDNKQNGTERGVDCGGSCALICPSEARTAKAMWQRSFLVASSTYTAVAYVPNTNAGAGARQVHYTFTLRDKNQTIVAERDGVVDLPPVQNIPIVETGIDVGYRDVARTDFKFTGQQNWIKLPANTLPALSIRDEALSPGGTRLSAMVANDSFDDVSSITVVAILYDSKENAVAASKSVIHNLPRKSSQLVVFTWPRPNPAVSYAEVKVLPTF